MKETVLQVKNLKVYYEHGSSFVKAVDDISFQVQKKQCFGLVGESGSGKTTVAKAILKILPSNARIVGGNIYLKNRDITNATEKEMENMRWTRVSLVTQSAMNALNPVATIADQIIETFSAAGSYSKKDILEKCRELFDKVGLDKNRVFNYPHQFSGGMRQRVIIAMAIALNPDLIIADEPTTALDVIMQAQIINLLRSLSEERDISLILITHDISIVAEICQMVGVMYAGRLMEYGDIDKVFNNPFHPYTMGLQGAFPTIRELNKSLISIPGSPPMLINCLLGCRFSDRCPFSIEKCEREIPETVMVDNNHSVACHRIEYAANFREEIKSIFGTKVRMQHSL